MKQYNTVSDSLQDAQTHTHRQCQMCVCVLQVIIALLLGYMVAAVITSNGGKHYVTSSQFDEAPSITFLWVKTFGFGFYAPAVLPFLIGIPAVLVLHKPPVLSPTLTHQRWVEMPASCLGAATKMF